MTDEKGKQQLALEEPFPAAMLDTVPKQGRNLTYVPAGEVIQRLNDVLGTTGWAWKADKIWRDSVNPEWVLAYGSMTCTIDGKTTTKSGSGGVKVKVTKAGEIVDLGDEFKGAESDALKKAAQRFGVGLWLARSAEARAYEAPTPVRDPIAEGWESQERANQFCNELNARVKAAPADVQGEMREFRDKNQLIWPPTFEGYELMAKKFAELMQAWEKAAEQEAMNQEPTPPPLSRTDELELAKAGIPPEELQQQTEEPENLPSEPTRSSDSLPKPPDDPKPQPTGNPAVDKITEAFPGAEDVTPAHPDEIALVEGYLKNIQGSQASVRAWNKYAKEKGYPKDRSTWTSKQAREAADFIETL